MIRPGCHELAVQVSGTLAPAMTPRPPFDGAQRRYAWALGILGAATALISYLTRPETDDIDGLIGTLGLVFSLSFLVLLGLSVLAARLLLSSGAARVTTIVAGPILGLFLVLFVVRLIV